MHRADVEELLDHVRRAGSQKVMETLRDVEQQLLQHLDEEEVFDTLQEAISHYNGVAAAVMRLAGYPRNARALRSLFELASEINQNHDDACFALQAMPPHIVAKQAISFLMDKGQTIPDWKILLSQWIWLVQILGEAFLAPCMPTLAWLLAQEDLWSMSDLDILGCFDDITEIDAYHYFLPALRRILKQSPNLRVRTATQSILERFSPNIRDIYFPEYQKP